MNGDEPVPLEPSPPLPPRPEWMREHHARLAFARMRVRGGTLIENYRAVCHERVPASDRDMTYAQWLATTDRIAPQELVL